MSTEEETEPKQSEFDEFKNQDYADWKRVRASIEHENTLVNHRLGWLFTSQTFLFTAFTFALHEWRDPAVTGPAVTGKESLLYLLGIIAFLGFSICLLIWRSLIHAAAQLRRLDRWRYTEKRNELTMDELSKPYGRNNTSVRENKLPKHPPLQGYAQSVWDDWINSYTIPVFFIVAWALIFMFFVLDMSSGIAKMLSNYGVQGLSYVLIIIATLVLREYFSHHRK